MQTDRVRLGVLSTANIADSIVKAIHMCPDAELSAVASRDAGRAREWAAARNVPLAFGSYEEMLASDAIDAVYIPLPNALHKEWSIAAARQGKHVLCEKPLAANAAEVEEMIAAERETGVKMMEAFMYRFHPQTARIKELIAGGAVGDVRIIRATFDFLLRRTVDVRLSRELAGGALMDVGCYCASITRFVAGAEPLSVTASAVMGPSGVDTSLAATLEFPGGVLGVMDCSFLAGPTMQQWLGVSGTAGHMGVAYPFRQDDDTPVITIERRDRGAPVELERHEVERAYSYHLMVEHFVGAVLGKHALAYTLQDSLAQMRTIDALREAARSGRRVEVAS